jgi:hypothetical protein
VDLPGIEGGHESQRVGRNHLARHQNGETRRVRRYEAGGHHFRTGSDLARQLIRANVFGCPRLVRLEVRGPKVAVRRQVVVSEAAGEPAEVRQRRRGAAQCAHPGIAGTPSPRPERSLFRVKGFGELDQHLHQVGHGAAGRPDVGHEKHTVA